MLQVDLVRHRTRAQTILEFIQSFTGYVTHCPSLPLFFFSVSSYTCMSFEIPYL